MENRERNNIIEDLDDREILMVFQGVFQRVYSHTSEPDIAATADGDVTVLTSLDDNAREFALDPEASLQTARQILSALANNDELTPLLVQCIEDVRANDDMLVETVLAFGIVSCMALLVASIEFKIQIGDTVIIKHKTDPELVKAVMAPITKLAEGITQGLS